MVHLLLHSVAYFVVSTLCTETYITVCDHVVRDKYRHSKNEFVINFKILVFFQSFKSFCGSANYCRIVYYYDYRK